MTKSKKYTFHQAGSIFTATHDAATHNFSCTCPNFEKNDTCNHISVLAYCLAHPDKKKEFEAEHQIDIYYDQSEN